jgi:hypothetical protein
VLIVTIPVEYKVLERPNCNRPFIRNSVSNEMKEISSEFYLNLTLRSHFEVAAPALTSVSAFVCASLVSVHVDEASPNPVSVCVTRTRLLVVFHIANDMFV